MLTNGLLKNKIKVSEKIQKAIMAGIGITTSKELIKRAAIGLYDDIQKVVSNLLSDLEERGEIKAKEAKKIINELEKKSDVEKERVYKQLQKESSHLLNSAKDMILTPIVFANRLKKIVKNQKNKTKKRSRKKSKVR